MTDDRGLAPELSFNSTGEDIVFASAMISGGVAIVYWGALGLAPLGYGVAWYGTLLLATALPRRVVSSVVVAARGREVASYLIAVTAVFIGLGFGLYSSLTSKGSP